MVRQYKSYFATLLSIFWAACINRLTLFVCLSVCLSRQHMHCLICSCYWNFLKKKVQTFLCLWSWWKIKHITSLKYIIFLPQVTKYRHTLHCLHTTSKLFAWLKCQQHIRFHIFNISLFCVLTVVSWYPVKLELFLETLGLQY